MERKWAKRTNKMLMEVEKEKMQKLINIECYRGVRHAQGLPVKGQRTKTNATTARKLQMARIRMLGVFLPEKMQGLNRNLGARRPVAKSSAEKRPK